MGKSFKHIETINYEAVEFISAFRRFRGSCNAIDETLCKNLLQMVCEIDDFINSKPKEISGSRVDQLSSNDLNSFAFHKAIICKKCNLEVGNSFDRIRSHLKSDRHQKATKENCKNGTNEVKAKLGNKTLSKKAMSLMQPDLQSTYKYTSNRRTERYQKALNENSKNRTNAVKAKLENKTLPKKALSLIQSDMILHFTTSVAVAEKLRILPDYNVIENDLLTLIRPAFSNKPVKLYLFGSRISGIANIISDLDIFIDIGDVFNKFENRASLETINKLEITKKLLQTDPNWSQLVAIKNARVPILKVLHKSTSINCDIGFSNSLGFCNTKLMQYFLELQPIAKAMCLVLKKFLRLTKLNEYITTYSAVLLVVTYLQKKGILPSVNGLQDGLDDPVEIGPWMAAFAQKTLIDLNIPVASYAAQDFKNELKLFFNFYGSFDFEHNLICPYLGSMVNLETSPQLPRYLKYIMADPDDSNYTHLKKSFMNVRDPLQLNHNVTKAVPATVVSLLKHNFQMAAAALQNALVIPCGPDVGNLTK